MAVPGRPVPDGAPADLARTELFAVDAYLRDFEARVEDVDAEGHRVRAARAPRSTPAAAASRTTSAA